MNSHMPRGILGLFFFASMQLLVLNLLLHDIAKTYSSIVIAAESNSLSASTIASEVIIVGKYYAVVIDAGSTGSRSFVFNITETVSSDSSSSDEKLTNQR